VAPGHPGGTKPDAFPMKNRLPTVSLDEIPTLVDHHRNGRFVIAFCPVCDRMAEAPDDGRGREGTAAVCIAEIKLHIRKAHRPKSLRAKATDGIRP